jgi:hypothetical protein
MQHMTGRSRSRLVLHHVMDAPWNRKRELTMLTLTHDQRGLLDYLADQVHVLAAAARDADDVQAVRRLIGEAEELMAIRSSIIARHHVAEDTAQLPLPLEVLQAA